MGDERDYEIPADRLPFRPHELLLDRLPRNEREKVYDLLAELGRSLRHDAEGDEPQD